MDESLPALATTPPRGPPLDGMLVSFCYDRNMNNPVSFQMSDALYESVTQLLEEQRQNLIELVPGTNIEHIGSTAIPGLLTKGDLDILVRVSVSQFHVAIEQLKQRYKVAQPHNWTDTFASFKDDSGEIPVGIQLVVNGGAEDVMFRRHQALLKGDAALRQAYNALKQRFEGRSGDDYWQAKDAFFKKLASKE